ncbi:MAG: MurR/RpiR family transcriptional regulator [Thermovirgaceae bacterium]|nr:MurR/RpiR family transcriptional regulator [Thermovirgaceae bacterium]
MKEFLLSKISDMSPSQLKIARFILDSPQEVAFLTASRLASLVGVSEATVVRFASFLGFDGYGKMKDSISHMVLDELSTVERIRDYRKEAEGSYLEMIVGKDVEALSRVQGHIPENQVEELSKAIVEAKAVFVAGSRSSYALAYYLHYYLSWIRPAVTLLSENTAFETLENVGKGSLVIGISFPRYTRWTVEILQYAREKGLERGSITDSLVSPLAMESSFVVTVPYTPVSFIDSFTAPICLINCIILSVSRKLGDSIPEMFAALESLWARNRTYLFPGKLPTSLPGPGFQG